MGFFDFITRAFRREETKAATSAPTSTDAGNATSPRDYYYNLIDSTQPALTVSTVYRCVRLLSESVAQMPLQYLRLKDGYYQEDVNHRLHYLMTMQPDEALSAFDMKAQAVVQMLMDGSAYIVPVYSAYGTDIERMVLCNRGTVKHDTDNDTYTITDLKNNLQGVFDESEVIHLKMFTRGDGKTGLSVLRYAAGDVNIATAGASETLKRFQHGGNVRGILSNDVSAIKGFGEYQDDELRRAAQDMDKRINYEGERIVAAYGSSSFTPFTMSSADMQFLETRKFSVREICRFFGVHPSFVFDDTSNNYKSAEMANTAFLSNTLNPLLCRIEAEFNRKLIPASLCCKRKFQFDRTSLHACDLEGKANYYTKMLANGAFNVNDIRRRENLPPVEGGDKVLVSANLRTIDEVGAQPQPSTNNNDNNDNNNNPDEKGTNN